MTKNSPRGADQKLTETLNRLIKRKKFEMHIAESHEDRKESK